MTNKLFSGDNLDVLPGMRNPDPVSVKRAKRDPAGSQEPLI